MTTGTRQDAGKVRQAIRDARCGLALVFALALAGEAVTVGLFLLLGAFDAESIALLVGGTFTCIMGTWVAARIFRGEIRRLQAYGLSGPRPGPEQD